MNKNRDDENVQAPGELLLLAAKLARSGKPDQAEGLFRAILARDAGNADARRGLDQLLATPPRAAIAPLVALQRQGRPEELIARGEAMLSRYPRSAFLLNLVGMAHAQLARPDRAADCYRRAISLDPGFAAAFNNLGNLLRAHGRRDAAVRAYDRALAINPDFAEARIHRHHLLSHACDWAATAADSDFLPKVGIEGAPVSPFAMLSADGDLMRQRQRAERFAARQFVVDPLPARLPPARMPDRLRIGYFSADFHDHATMYLMAGMLEQHDRQAFEIHAFSYGPPADDAMRRRLLANVDAFHDVRSMSDRSVAELARREGIDIAVDLKGYTYGMRAAILAYRPAPVQIAFLGYPGTMGASFIDYLVTDRTIIPDAFRCGYSEKMLYLPHCAQPNDDRRPIANLATSRLDAGLPEDGFVFCCFNSSYKITPVEFDLWMRLLAATEGSVLWLMRCGQDSCANLAAAARDRGIDPDRLRFAEKLPHDQHLARLKLADLFLDTFLVNAHTTASDALWAGLPLISCPGESFASRVAASLLNAAGLPDLIARNHREYEQLALELASDRERLDEVRLILARRRSSPLFDTARFTRAIEDGYRCAYQRHVDGLEPDDILVEDRF